MTVTERGAQVSDSRIATRPARRSAGSRLTTLVVVVVTAVVIGIVAFVIDQPAAGSEPVARGAACGTSSTAVESEGDVIGVLQNWIFGRPRQNGRGRCSKPGGPARQDEPSTQT